MARALPIAFTVLIHGLSLLEFSIWYVVTSMQCFHQIFLPNLDKHSTSDFLVSFFLALRVLKKEYCLCKWNNVYILHFAFSFVSGKCLSLHCSGFPLVPGCDSSRWSSFVTRQKSRNEDWIRFVVLIMLISSYLESQMNRSVSLSFSMLWTRCVGYKYR